MKKRKYAAPAAKGLNACHRPVTHAGVSATGSPGDASSLSMSAGSSHCTPTLFSGDGLIVEEELTQQMDEVVHEIPTDTLHTVGKL